MANSSTKKFPVNSKDYELYEEVGEGVSATVYKALCIPHNEVVAIKVLDLERCKSDLENIRREVHTMTLIDHPNLLKAHCSFTAGSCLWIVMPYMTGGSSLHIMKSAYPEGIEQPVIATLLREVLKSLVYLHEHGYIHRDVKAGNILVDSKGAVKLGDFGVSACMFESGDRQRARNTFVGTPCWMAPEVMQQMHGYDFKADIWSFGITALELAHGHAPFSKYPPMKVLLMTLQNAPPGLDYERDKKFSKSFKEIVAACLAKDPKKRPTSAKLLKHPFFKHARSSDYLARKILDGLSPLGDRYRMLKEREAHLLLQNKDINSDKEQLSQQEYIRGISTWNFDLDDLKKQAAFTQDDDISSAENQDLGGKHNCGFDNVAASAECLPVERSNIDSNSSNSPSSPEDETNQPNYQFTENLPASLPIHFPQALKSVSEEPLELLSSMDRKQTRSLGSDKILDTPNGFINPLLGQAVNSMSGIPASCLPVLQRLLQQNAMQREQVTRIIRYVDFTSGNHMEFAKVAANSEDLQISFSTRERDLQSQVICMQQSIGKLVEELQRQKTINAQLERQISSLSRNKNP